MLTVLGGLAEFERELIRERTEEGRQRAMDRGVKFGRPSRPRTSARRRLSGYALATPNPMWRARMASIPP